MKTAIFIILAIIGYNSIAGGMDRRTEHCGREVCAGVRHIIQSVAGTLRRVLALRRAFRSSIYSGAGVFWEQR